jgi:hypothetical protein
MSSLSILSTYSESHIRTNVGYISIFNSQEVSWHHFWVTPGKDVNDTGVLPSGPGGKIACPIIPRTARIGTKDVTTTQTRRILRIPKLGTIVPGAQPDWVQATHCIHLIDIIQLFSQVIDILPQPKSVGDSNTEWGTHFIVCLGKIRLGHTCKRNS